MLKRVFQVYILLLALVAWSCQSASPSAASRLKHLQDSMPCEDIPIVQLNTVWQDHLFLDYARHESWASEPYQYHIRSCAKNGDTVFRTLTILNEYGDSLFQTITSNFKGKAKLVYRKNFNFSYWNTDVVARIEDSLLYEKQGNDYTLGQQTYYLTGNNGSGDLFTGVKYETIPKRVWVQMINWNGEIMVCWAQEDSIVQSREFQESGNYQEYYSQLVISFWHPNYGTLLSRNPSRWSLLKELVRIIPYSEMQEEISKNIARRALKEHKSYN